ncbi:hypothetical protein IW140_002710 [Coemansia sp. RSA 1813]|nr:hypothetical protein EV178_000214 [Coemansia sp. RSA 1646]KAJ1769539.1 hypothetical protein LPJ74_003959 [Coemansia sp. RSA 1843]KAJ2090477.1 hypothetical protein IW138_002689 [Coemansia sp. RSA 986]KAJ2215444.1 hypothetical protein EV179_002229 [Coemansia sp. RSA 487]KAJ2570033.1 hypothetical protein IW140_002710 [Coemansia sp. RSA 1813]
MRLVALTTLIAAACAAPLAVRQTIVGESDADSKQVNGPVAVDHPNINNGAMEEGSLDSGLSFDGAVIAGASGNSLTDVNKNLNFHDNIVSNPTLNLASDTEGGAVVGSGNQIFAPGDSGPQNIAFKREAPVDVSNVNAPAAVNDPTVNNGAMSEGSMDPDLSFDDAAISNPVGNSLAQVNDNTEVSDNNFVDPSFNEISGNVGPAMAGDNDVFIPINNQGMIVNLDPGFIEAQQASQQALINHFIHPGFGI